MSRLKDFLLTWVVPPGIEAARQRRLIPPLQKFWHGAPVPAPPRETGFFERQGLTASTVTRDDDSRSAATVIGDASLPLPEGAAGEAVQFAVAAERWRPGDRIVVSAGGIETGHAHLRTDRWLDMRIDVPPGTSEIAIRADAPIHVSFPRAVRTRSAAPGVGPGIRHVLVIVLDAMTPRLDAGTHPSLHGTVLTPNMDRFFAGGFEAPLGISSAEWTLPTTASFFTGLFTSRHGHYHPQNPTFLPQGRTLLAEYFQGLGFHTLCMSAANRLTPAFGSHRGFDRFIYHWPYEGFTRRNYDPAVWIAEATGHLDLHRLDRTFTYVHFPDTHPVWEIPPLTRAFNLSRRGDGAGHDLAALRGSAEAGAHGAFLAKLRLHELDRLLGGLFDFIDRNLAEQTLVVLTSDHGTPWHHLRPRRDESEPTLVHDRIAIGCRMRGPGIPDRRLSSLASPTLDLLPTLLACAGEAAPNDLDGRNLLDPDYRRDHVISESLYGGVYELAVIDRERMWFEKFPLDECSMRLSGSAFYGRGFPFGATDYTTALDGNTAPLPALARDHRARVGLSEPNP